MSSPGKKSKKPQKICTWIRDRISPYCFGVKTKAGNPAHCNRNDDIKYHFQCLKSGWYGRRLSRLKNKEMADHFAGKKTFYFTSDGRSRTAEVLINIDIDCHKSGTIQGALAFVEHLKATKFPSLYFESSTNGNGAHGYVVVVKGKLGDEGLNGALSNLDKWLKAELSKGIWDVENVEVKAHCPEFTWGKEKFELKGYQSGQLAKLPREALTRADELRGTTRVAVDDLRRLKVPVRNVESDDSIVGVKKKSATKRPVLSVRESENQDEETLVVSPPAKKKVSGSISGRHFDDDELAKLKHGYLSLTSELLAGEVLVTSGRKVVKEEDLAVFLMLLRFFTANMNANGSLPTARWREVWKALFEAGDIGRAWCHHRFAAMRNFLSDKDLLSWQDEGFVVGVVGEDGQFVPGEAAKWHGSTELMSMMDQADEQDVVGVVGEQDFETGAGRAGFVSEISVIHVVQVEEREEGESTLYGCKHQDQGQAEYNKEGESIFLGYKSQVQGQAEGREERRSTLYGCTDYEIPIVTPESRQSASFLEDLERLGLVIPLQRPRFMGFSTGQYRKAA